MDGRSITASPKQLVAQIIWPICDRAIGAGMRSLAGF